MSRETKSCVRRKKSHFLFVHDVVYNNLMAKTERNAMKKNVESLAFAVGSTYSFYGLMVITI